MFIGVSGILLIGFGLAIGLKLIRNKSKYHLIGNGVPLCYWVLFSLNCLVKSGDSDFFEMMPINRP